MIIHKHHGTPEYFLLAKVMLFYAKSKLINKNFSSVSLHYLFIISFDT